MTRLHEIKQIMTPTPIRLNVHDNNAYNAVFYRITELYEMGGGGGLVRLLKFSTNVIAFLECEL